MTLLVYLLQIIKKTSLAFLVSLFLVFIFHLQQVFFFHLYVHTSIHLFVQDFPDIPVLPFSFFFFKSLFRLFRFHLSGVCNGASSWFSILVMLHHGGVLLHSHQMFKSPQLALDVEHFLLNLRLSQVTEHETLSLRTFATLQRQLMFTICDSSCLKHKVAHGYWGKTGTT